MKDQELITLLLERISELSALGADALQATDGPHTRVVVQWLTEAATGLGQAAQAEHLLDGVELAPEWRERIEAAL